MKFGELNLIVNFMDWKKENDGSFKEFGEIHKQIISSTWVMTLMYCISQFRINRRIF